MSTADDLEQAYISVREKILFGRIVPGADLDLDALEAELEIPRRALQHVVTTLVSQGYAIRIGKGRSSRVIAASTPPEQIEEWAYLCCAMMEIGTTNLVISNGDKIDALEKYVDEKIRKYKNNEFGFYSGAIGLMTHILGGPKSEMNRLLTRLVPSIFYRIFWLAEVSPVERSYLVVKIDDMLAAARKRDLVAVMACCREFYDAALPAILEAAEDRLDYSGAKADPIFETGELEIIPSGYRVVVGGPSMPEPLMPVTAV